MNSLSEQQVSLPSNQWLGVTEAIAVVGSVGTAIAALASQQFVAAASLPLSLSLIVSLANRDRLLKRMDATHQVQIAELLQARETHRLAIAALEQQGQSLGVHLVDVTHKEEHNKTLAEGNAQLLKNLTATVEQQGQLQAEMTEQIIHLQKATAFPDEFYYEEALAKQQAGELEAALGQLNLALKANEAMAEAYYQRGLVQAELGQRQAAIADLRTSASLFFEQGKLEQYQKAKDLSKNVHEALAKKEPEVETYSGNGNAPSPKTADSVFVGSLFN